MALSSTLSSTHALQQSYASAAATTAEDKLQQERYGGISVYAAIAQLDLARDGISPIIRGPYPSYRSDVAVPDRGLILPCHGGSKYLLADSAKNNYADHYLTMEQLEVMRARYFLLRDYYASHLDRFSVKQQASIHSWYQLLLTEPYTPWYRPTS